MMCSDVLRCSQMFSDDHICFWIFSRYSINVLLMFPGCLQDFSRMSSGCFDGSCGPGGIWWTFQMKVWTLMIQRNSMIPNYLMFPAIRWSLAIQWSPAIWWAPAIRWSQAIWWSPAILWSIGSMDFDDQKVYGDTFISDGLVLKGVYSIDLEWSQRGKAKAFFF